MVTVLTRVSWEFLNLEIVQLDIKIVLLKVKLAMSVLIDKSVCPQGSEQRAAMQWGGGTGGGWGGAPPRFPDPCGPTDLSMRTDMASLTFNTINTSILMSGSTIYHFARLNKNRQVGPRQVGARLGTNKNQPTWSTWQPGHPARLAFVYPVMVAAGAAHF